MSWTTEKFDSILGKEVFLYFKAATRGSDIKLTSHSTHNMTCFP